MASAICYYTPIVDRVKLEKDLGLAVDTRLTFEKHISDKVNKANQMMGLVRRSFIFMDHNNFRWLFKAIVHPHLEYINSVWSPMRKKDINTIENVQRRATKMIPGLKDLLKLSGVAESTKATNASLPPTKRRHDRNLQGDKKSV